MPATINGGGDQLARGAVRATFRSAIVTQEKWNAIWGEESGPKLNNAEEVEHANAGPAPTRKRKRKSK